ncbi:hypothetical protein MPH_00921 [Macrophomina phaseolina MS6]|uniref:Uncharacterized protein n=1 Tax=Macrophomina phaseolina (strain MS6) TaxID=1126212 RepID=K2SYQ5_MACPH|nr:hypothetical protein MPH_00921 [Macrophomina phaseolina MS6]
MTCYGHITSSEQACSDTILRAILEIFVQRSPFLPPFQTISSMCSTASGLPGEKELEDILWHRAKALAALEGRYDTREDKRSFEDWVRDYLIEMASTWTRCWNLPDVLLTMDGGYVLVKKERRRDSHFPSPLEEAYSETLVLPPPRVYQPNFHNTEPEPPAVCYGAPNGYPRLDSQDFLPKSHYYQEGKTSPGRPRLHLASAEPQVRPRLVLETQPAWQYPHCCLEFAHEARPAQQREMPSAVPKIARKIPNERRAEDVTMTSIWPPLPPGLGDYPRPSSSHYADARCRPGHPAPYRPGHYGIAPAEKANPPLQPKAPHAPARKLPSPPAAPKKRLAAVRADSPKYTRRDESRRPIIQAPRPVRPHALVRGHATAVVAGASML